MLHIKLVCLGKLKEKYWQAAQGEYLKRLSAFAKVEIVELKEEKFDEKISPPIIKEKEAQLLKNALNKFPDAFVVVLDEHGKQFSSVEFSKKLSFSSFTFTHQMIRVFLLEQVYRTMMIVNNRQYHY